jgi:hypothetical protein
VDRSKRHGQDVLCPQIELKTCQTALTIRNFGITLSYMCVGTVVYNCHYVVVLQKLSWSPSYVIILKMFDLQLINVRGCCKSSCQKLVMNSNWNIESQVCNSSDHAIMINKTGNARITWHWGSFVQPLLQWKSSRCYVFRECGCSLKYPARKAHALYYICDVSGSALLFHIIHKRRDVRKKNLERKMCVLVFSKTFVWNISHYK